MEASKVYRFRRHTSYSRVGTSLEDALGSLSGGGTTVIEIVDSLIHDLDLSAVGGTVNEDGGFNLQLEHPLVIRAASGQCPIVRLAQPLRVRPSEVFSADTEIQKELDDRNGGLTLRLEGLSIIRDASFPAGEALIERAALHRLEIVDSTLDPGGRLEPDGLTGQPSLLAMCLRDPFGFADAQEEEAFKESPEVVLSRSVSGALELDDSYYLEASESIIDAGSGVHTPSASASLAISSASDGPAGWGPRLSVDGVTIFGACRLRRLSGRGGIFVHRCEVLDHQQGCIKFSYLRGEGDRLPQNHACVRGTEAVLDFTSERFGEPAYAQLSRNSDFRIRERGPREDAMGAFGFLLEAHKWRNLQIRFREFMPVGVRPLLVPVT